MSDVPSNLIPTRITQLPDAPEASEDGLLLFTYQGVSYKIRAGDLLSVAGVPNTRQVIAGTGLTGGGQLSSNVTLSISNGGVGTTQLADSGVTAGTYGSASSIPVVIVDSTGRVTSISTVPISISGVVPDTRQVNTGNGLTGGGALSSNLTISADFDGSLPSSNYQSGIVGSSNKLSRSDHQHPSIALADSNQVSGLLGLSNGGTGKSIVPASGAILYSGADGVYVGPVGPAGQVLSSNGSGAYSWVSVETTADQAANTVRAGPTSGSPAAPTFRSLVTNDLPSSGATAGTYGSATKTTTVTVNAKGQITSISEQAVDLSSPTGTLPVANGGTGTNTSFTQGSIIFAGPLGVYNQNNSNLFWDSANIRLGLGTSSPATNLDILGSITTQLRVRMSGQADTRVIADTGTGIIGTYSNHQLVIRTNGINALTISTAQDSSFSGTATAPRFISTVSTGTAPFTVASTTNVANLNASSLNGATFASPGPIGGTTPSTATFTNALGYQASPTDITNANIANNSVVGIRTGSPDVSITGGQGSGIKLQTLQGRGGVFLGALSPTTNKELIHFVIYTGSDLSSGASYGERMRVLGSTGNVLINTTTDNTTDKLQVNGSISSTGLTVNGTTALTGATTLTNGSTIVTVNNTSQNNLRVEGINAVVAVNSVASSFPGFFVYKQGTLMGAVNADGVTGIRLVNNVADGITVLSSASGSRQLFNTTTDDGKNQFQFNGNAIANSFDSGILNVVSAGGTTVLTSSSPKNIIVTGTLSQTIQMPVVTTLTNGRDFVINNASSNPNTVSVNSSGGNSLAVISTTGGIGWFKVLDNTAGTGTASWNSTYATTENAAGTLVMRNSSGATRLGSLALGSLGSGTNVAAGNGVIQNPNGTGTGSVGKMLFAADIASTTSGTTAHIQVNRLALNGYVAGLTSGAASTVLTPTIASNSVAAGVITYSIEANNATDFQVVTGQVSYSIANKAGTITGSVGSLTTANTTTTGTIAASFSITAAGLVQVTPTVTGITATTLRIVYNVQNLGQQDISLP